MSMYSVCVSLHLQVMETTELEALKMWLTIFGSYINATVCGVSVSQRETYNTFGI